MHPLKSHENCLKFIFQCKTSSLLPRKYVTFVTNNCDKFHFIMSHTHCHACCSYSFNIFLRTVLELDEKRKNREALEYGKLRHCTEVQDSDFFTNCTAISIDKKQIIRQIVGDAVQGTPQSANEANPRHPEATLPLQPPPTHQNLNSGASYA